MYFYHAKEGKQTQMEFNHKNLRQKCMATLIQYHSNIQLLVLYFLPILHSYNLVHFHTNAGIQSVNFTFSQMSKMHS